VTVRWLQRELVNHGYDILVDGDFGPKTAAAVRDFQLQNDLVVDEIVGKKTVAALLK
jgi:peptidoglycan hydrolase-like protein with peptidoglycan-binding domain